MTNVPAQADDLPADEAAQAEPEQREAREARFGTAPERGEEFVIPTAYIGPPSVPRGGLGQRWRSPLRHQDED
jgi:hypothetical protein